jgi:hypothetical protein
VTTLQMFRTLAIYAIVTTLTLIVIAIASAATAKTSYAKTGDVSCDIDLAGGHSS